MQRLLREAGLEVSNENNQYADHIGIELLYASVLCQRAAEACDAGDETRASELESQLASRHFLRISKSTIVNLMKVEAIKPALNGRFLVRLRNGEDVIVSRKYVPALKAALEEGSIS